MRHKAVALAFCSVAVIALAIAISTPSTPAPALAPSTPGSEPQATIVLAPSSPTPAPLPTETSVPPTATAVVEQRIIAPASARGAALPPSTASINGVPIDQIVVLSDAVQQQVRQIAAKGRSLGRDPRCISKVGDSTMVWPPFLAAFEDHTVYNLGPYSNLQATISNLAGSLSRTGIAARANMHTWTEFDPTWAVDAPCNANEGPLACELRVHNPSIAIIRLGANDAFMPAVFEEQMGKIIDFCIANGVVPILGTKPDRVEGPDNTINKIIHNMASARNLPLWDYDLIAGTVPEKGLQDDKLHFRAGGSHDYASADAFKAADSLEDLTGLMALQAVLNAIQP